MKPRFKPSFGISELIKIFRLNKNSVEQFEIKFAKKFDAVDAVAFPYGRSAQWAFLESIGMKNSEIIMPAYTCSVVAHAISISGNKPVFIDINLEDFNMDLNLVEKAINNKTKAIIATHTFGYAQDVNKLEEIIRIAEHKYGNKIYLIQDCCHAFDARFDGKLISSSGDVSIYAFNISKMMSSIFGGMLTFQDKDLANKVREWRDKNFIKPSLSKAIKRRLYLIAVFVAFNKTIYKLTWWLQSRTKILDQFTKAYHLDEKIHFPPDYLEKMTDIEAAVGLAQLEKYSDIIKNRIKNAKRYNKLLIRKKGWRLPPIREGSTYSHYVVLVPNKNEVIAEYASKGEHLGELIQYVIPLLKCYSESENPKDYPNSLKASNEAVNFNVTD